MQRNSFKGNLWRRLFRNGYNASNPKGTAAKYNGTMAKTDAHTNKSKLRKFLNMIEPMEDNE